MNNALLTKNNLICYITAEQIASRIKELAAEITQDFKPYFTEDNKNENLIIIGVLKGAYIFTADLVRHLDLPIQMEFIRISSYGDQTESTGKINIPDLFLPPDIFGKKILIVEDIVDTGQTAEFLINYIKQQFKPEFIKMVSLLNKPSRRKVQIDADYYGFEIEDKFVVGYGLDYAEKYRELGYLGYFDI